MKKMHPLEKIATAVFAVAALLALAGMVACLIAMSAILSTPAHAEEAPRFDARETLRRAQVGPYAPRSTSLPRSKVRGPSPASVERLVCYVSPAEPQTITCEPRRGP